MVRHFWALEGQPERRVIIGREYGYHGSTIMFASMGGMSGMGDQAADEADFAHIRPPYGFSIKAIRTMLFLPPMRRPGLKTKSSRLVPTRWLLSSPSRCRVRVVIVPPDGYFEHIQNICKRYDILFIVDEVITGFGRTGEWFASQRMNLSPDMMTMAKGLTSGYMPMSGVMVGDRVADIYRRWRRVLSRFHLFRSSGCGCGGFGQSRYHRE